MQGEMVKVLEQEIDYEKRKMECCGYGRSDLRYLVGLEMELESLPNKEK